MLDAFATRQPQSDEYQDIMSTNRAVSIGLLWLGIGALVFAPPGACSASPSPIPKPNILIILTDDQGRGDYSAFGTRDIRTPNMDRLFREGMTFHNFFANSCVCSPSRAALLTGCYPDRVGVPGVIREETPNDSWGYLVFGRKLPFLEAARTVESLGQVNGSFCVRQRPNRRNSPPPATLRLSDLACDFKWGGFQAARRAVAARAHSRASSSRPITCRL